MPSDSDQSCCDPEASGTRFHASLNVADLSRSIDFYRLLFGCEPAKQRHDYAKFEPPDLPLVLSLIPGHWLPGVGNLNHFGMRMSDSEALVKIQHRLEVAGVKTKREEGVECCYAKQTKFWVADPDRALWEVYVFHEDIDEPGDDKVPAVESFSTPDEAAAEPRVVWEHRLGTPAPERIPHEDFSVHEVALEGSANQIATDFQSLLVEALRVLRPGGHVRIHGLSGDSLVTQPFPQLPGPASVVEFVPSHAQIVVELERAGFVNARLEDLSETVHFTIGSVPLREIVVSAKKPGHRPKRSAYRAVYLGPLASVTDDFGNVFRRGEVISLNVHDWHALHEEASTQFLLLPPD